MLKRMFLTAALLCLPVIVFAGIEVSVTGGDWVIGEIDPSDSTSTSGGYWEITGGDTLQEIDIRVSSGIHGPSASGVSGEDLFVLRESSSTGLIISTTDVNLATMDPGATYYLDLYFQAPNSDSTSGENIITVTLTAKPFMLEADEWYIIDDDLVAVGTGDGHLMWPRPESCEGTNNNSNLSWATDEAYAMPEWSDTTKTYSYPSGRSADDYPAFEWAENLDWKGYDDWRLPTGDGSDPAHKIGPSSGGELKHLWDAWDDDSDLIDSDTWWFLSSTELGTYGVHVVRFSDGNVSDYDKDTALRVRAVRWDEY